MGNLYQRCPHHDARPSSAALCMFCGGERFIPVGVTLSQFERLVDTERVLQGDPGVSDGTRDLVLKRMRKRLEESP